MKRAEIIRKRHRVEWGRRVKLARDAIGLTQTQLGEVVGEEKSTISGWETGRNAPSVDFLLHFYEKCGIDPTYIITGRTDGLSVRIIEKIQQLEGERKTG